MLKTIKKIAIGALLAGLLLTLVPLLVLRWLPPPTTAFMLVDRVQRLMDDGAVKPQRYTWVPLEKITPDMLLAVVAAEDQKFPLHYGFDMDAMAAALQHNQRSARIRGGSTLTQQLAKNLFLWSGRSYIRKGLEAWFTLWIEWLLPKKRILELYVNVVEFGDGVYGVGAAAPLFFRKTPAQLSARDCALLAAVLPNPQRYRVDRPGSWVLERRDWIARQMRQLGRGYLQPVL
jgi:monofunctional biosynthetic peptidoglycan transglycosylase